jgi:hypothetical protein
MITFEHFFPQKLHSSNIFALVRNIIVFLGFFDNGLFPSFGNMDVTHVGCNRRNESEQTIQAQQ